VALAAQGFGDQRPAGRIDRRHLRRAMGRLGLLQLDSVPVVIRSHYLPLFSRLGPYDPNLADRVAYRDDEWFEAWSHEASLVPVATEPLLRWHKERCRQGQTWKGLVELANQEPGYVAEVLDQVRERPLIGSELSDPRPQQGQWWGSRSLGSLALDWLFRIGEVGIRRRSGFVKEFDLLDRIVPESIRSLPTPSAADGQRALVAQAARSLGVATTADLVDYFRLPKREGARRVEELREDGTLQPVVVEGWDRPAFLDRSATRVRAIHACTVLSPFDPVVWNRDRARRLFGFDYRLEIYTPEANRVFGYYVLPLLVGDRLMARIDGKTDRQAGVFRVRGAFAESGQLDGSLVEAAREALDQLSHMVGVEGWTVDGQRGDLLARLTSEGRRS